MQTPPILSSTCTVSSSWNCCRTLRGLFSHRHHAEMSMGFSLQKLQCSTARWGFSKCPYGMGLGIRWADPLKAIASQSKVTKQCNQNRLVVQMQTRTLHSKTPNSEGPVQGSPDSTRKLWHTKPWDADPSVTTRQHPLKEKIWQINQNSYTRLHLMHAFFLLKSIINTQG